MRKYFENISGVATGSDMVMKFQPNIALQFCGFKGEGITDDRVWIKKSHFPQVTPFQKGFQGDYGLVCTRNPLDCMPSYFFLMFACTHVETYVPCLLREDVIEIWQQWYKRAIDQWVLWHHYWIRQADSGKPIFFFRFEDILVSPRSKLRDLMGFVLGITGSEIDGTILEKRIDEVLAMGQKATQVYKPRQCGQGSNKNLVHYTEEMIDYCKEKAGDLLHFFGYVDVDPAVLRPDQMSTPSTPIFKIKSTTDQIEKFNLYKQYNVEAFANRRQY